MKQLEDVAATVSNKLPKSSSQSLAALTGNKAGSQDATD